MEVGRRDGAGEAIEGPQIEALGLEVLQLESFRFFNQHKILPRAGGYLDQNQREMANMSHYLDGYAEGEATQSKSATVTPKPSEEEGKAQWGAYLEMRDDDE